MVSARKSIPSAVPTQAVVRSHVESRRGIRAAEFCGSVCERNKKELNTLDEADFVRDVEKSSSH